MSSNLVSISFLVTTGTERSMAFMLTKMEAKLREIQIFLIIFGVMLPDIVLTNAGKFFFLYDGTLLLVSRALKLCCHYNHMRAHWHMHEKMPGKLTNHKTKLLREGKFENIGFLAEWNIFTYFETFSFVNLFTTFNIPGANCNFIGQSIN